MERDDLELAAGSFKRSARVHEELLSRSGKPPTAWIEGLATSYKALAEVHRAAANAEAASIAARSAIEARLRIVETDDAWTLIQLAGDHLMLAELHVELQRIDEAKQEAERTRSVLSRLARRFSHSQGPESPQETELYRQAGERLKALEASLTL